jgi:hypothetical protein
VRVLFVTGLETVLIEEGKEGKKELEEPKKQ